MVHDSFRFNAKAAPCHQLHIKYLETVEYCRTAHLSLSIGIGTALCLLASVLLIECVSRCSQTTNQCSSILKGTPERHVEEKSQHL